MSTMMYVVTSEDIDLAKVGFQNHISATSPSEGYGNICVIRCDVTEIESGYQALKAVYPEAEKTMLKREALRLAHILRGGRMQISSNVSADTKAQVDQLTALGYSVRDIVTLGIDILYREKVLNYKEYRGDNLVIELHQQGDVISYRLYGQSISEEVGTSRLQEADLLDVLLSPMNRCVVNSAIVTKPDFPQMIVVRDDIACDVNAVEVREDEPVFDRVEDRMSGRFVWYRQCSNYTNQISVDCSMNVYGGWRS